MAKRKGVEAWVAVNRRTGAVFGPSMLKASMMEWIAKAGASHDLVHLVERDPAAEADYRRLRNLVRKISAGLTWPQIMAAVDSYQKKAKR